jgi:hypothetical protein
MHDSNQQIIPQYLDRLDAQREVAYQSLEGLTPEQIWQRPAPGEWSIGEILNHNVLLFRSVSPLIACAWRCFRWTARLWPAWGYRTSRPDPYRRGSLIMRFGFFWNPKYTPDTPVSLGTLKSEQCAIHQRVRDFYTGKPEPALGRVYLFDPLLGFVNLIVSLRIGLYHDQLHYEDVIRMAADLRGRG